MVQQVHGSLKENRFGVLWLKLTPDEMKQH